MPTDKENSVPDPNDAPVKKGDDYDDSKPGPLDEDDEDEDLEEYIETDEDEDEEDED